MSTAQIIEKNGRKAFAVIPYARFRRMQEDLEDYACLKALRKARAGSRRGRPFLEFARERGYLNLPGKP
jgi:PHD/YefM family antitoxin component YafN of YafNO toxin-antitoxin module